MAADKWSHLWATDTLYFCDGDPGSTDWVRWHCKDKSRFNGPFGDLLTRRQDNIAIVRLQPHLGLGNVAGRVHGGAVMTFIDMAMFIGARALGVPLEPGGLTVDLNVQFIDGADLERPLDALIQVSRETGRLVFMRGTLEQGGDMISTFLGILRKPNR